MQPFCLCLLDIRYIRQQIQHTSNGRLYRNIYLHFQNLHLNYLKLVEICIQVLINLQLPSPRSRQLIQFHNIKQQVSKKKRDSLRFQKIYGIMSRPCFKISEHLCFNHQIFYYSEKLKGQDWSLLQIKGLSFPDKQKVYQ